MDILLLWFGLCVSLFGYLRLAQSLWFRSHYAQKWGQVVGFAEEMRGLFSVVLRFRGLDEKEYFLMEQEKSKAPHYVMGEFIPILVSKSSSKKCILFMAATLSHSVIQILVGGVALLTFFTLFTFTVGKLILSALVGFLIWFVVQQFPKNEIVKTIRALSVTQFLGQMKDPIILDVEKSKLIKWTQNYAGIFPEEKSSFDFNKAFFSVVRPICLLTAAAFIILAVVSFKSTTNMLESSTRAGAVYDGSVKRAIYQGLTLDVPVFRYYDQRKVIHSGVDLKTPFVFDLKKGEKLVALIPKDKNGIVRLDRGWLNHWKCLMFIFFGLVMVSLSSRSHAQMNKKVKKPVIFLRKVS